MADVGDDLLDGDLDETSFGDLDGEEEDALLADDDFETGPYQGSRQTVFAKTSQEEGTELFHIVDQVQDVSEGDEILEDGEEDVLELAVVDELDESELDNGQGNSQAWAETSTRTHETELCHEPTVGVSSSTNMRVIGHESDEEESDGRGSRFKAERTNIISLKGVSSGKSLSDIPDSLDKVKTILPSRGVRPRGVMQRRGSIRQRLGPGPMTMRGVFGPPRRPLMHPTQPHPPPPHQLPYHHPHQPPFQHPHQPPHMYPQQPPHQRPQQPPHQHPQQSSHQHPQQPPHQHPQQPPQHSPHQHPQQPPHQSPHQHPQPPPHQSPQTGHKIHINPHFRGGMHHPHSVWDNERLPPPPGCESFGSAQSPHQDNNWGGPPQHHMSGPPYQQPPGPYHNQQMYPPQQHNQGYEDQYQPPGNAPQQSQPNRIVQFSENTQLITVENQHFQGPAFDQSFNTPSNQYPPQNGPPHFNNNAFPNQFANSPPRPNFQPQPFPTPNQPPNFMNYPQEFNQPPNPQQFQTKDNAQNNWAPPFQHMENQTNQFYPRGSPQAPPPFCNPSQQPQFRPPFQNPRPNFRPPQSVQRQPSFQGGMRGVGPKRTLPQQPSNAPAVPIKQMRFENAVNKQKAPPVNLRSNLQMIKTVDNLPDTTTSQEPEPEIEEDEETKQYRLKIAEQKALREKILKEKEARRLASIIEKQNKQDKVTNSIAKTIVVPGGGSGSRFAKPIPALVPPHQMKIKVRAPYSNNRLIPKQQVVSLQPRVSNAPVIKIQQMCGTVYKIVKVRTKEGAIVTRKTPLNMTQTGTGAGNLKTAPTAAGVGGAQRRVVLPYSTSATARMVQSGGVGRGGGNAVRMPAHRIVQSNSHVGSFKGPQRLVVMPNSGVRPSLPVSSLVTVDNLSLSTSEDQIQKMAKQVGSLASFKHEPDLRRATLKFQKPKEAEQFYLKFHRKMIDLSRISITVIPE